VKELESVKSFKVSNEFGSVEFIGETDVTRVDLGDIINIEEKNLEVYDDERHVDKPAVGQKLNKPAIITLKNIKCKDNQTIQRKEDLLKKRLIKDDAEHLSYDGSTW
jgi:nuclear pore complex protein Nup98-Nup96